jgi:hypothetical protein
MQISDKFASTDQDFPHNLKTFINCNQPNNHLISKKSTKGLANLKLEKRSTFNSVSPAEHPSPFLKPSANTKIGIFERLNLKKKFGNNITNLKEVNTKTCLGFESTKAVTGWKTAQLVGGLKKAICTESTHGYKTPLINKNEPDNLNDNSVACNETNKSSTQNDILKGAEMMTVTTGVSLTNNSHKNRRLTQTSYERKLTHLKGTTLSPVTKKC